MKSKKLKKRSKPSKSSLKKKKLVKESPLTYPELIALARVTLFEATGDKTFLTNPYYDKPTSEPDYSVPELATAIINEKSK